MRHNSLAVSVTPGRLSSRVTTWTIGWRDSFGGKGVGGKLRSLPQPQEAHGHWRQDPQQIPQGLHRLQEAVFHAAASLEYLMEVFNGTITNDKFCMSRTGRLQLSWWRLPLRAREEVTNGVEYPSEGNTSDRVPEKETHEETAMERSASAHRAS